MTLEFEVDVDYLTDGGIKGMPTWVKLNDEDGEHTSTIYVNSSSYWCVVDENAKLRELCRRYVEYISQDRCEGCVYKMKCNNGLIDECWQLGEIRDLARELEMEVDI